MDCKYKGDNKCMYHKTVQGLVICLWKKCIPKLQRLQSLFSDGFKVNKNNLIVWFEQTCFFLRHKYTGEVTQLNARTELTHYQMHNYTKMSSEDNRDCESANNYNSNEAVKYISITTEQFISRLLEQKQKQCKSENFYKVCIFHFF